jgi:PIN domain nuclease of toxin-antitoxin system
VTSVLLDTHAWACSLAGDGRLSSPALAAMQVADAVFVSPITFFEIAQKARLGKWPEIAASVDQLPSLLQSQGGVVADFGPKICIEAGVMDWAHRDPFDRLLAATARQSNQLLVSADVVFDGVTTRVW